jgi:hypothetical protein
MMSTLRLCGRRAMQYVGVPKRQSVQQSSVNGRPIDLRGQTDPCAARRSPRQVARAARCHSRLAEHRSNGLNASSIGTSRTRYPRRVSPARLSVIDFDILMMPCEINVSPTGSSGVPQRAPVHAATAQPTAVQHVRARKSRGLAGNSARCQALATGPAPRCPSWVVRANQRIAFFGTAA